MPMTSLTVVSVGPIHSNTAVEIVEDGQSKIYVVGSVASGSPRQMQDDYAQKRPGRQTIDASEMLDRTTLASPIRASSGGSHRPREPQFDRSRRPSWDDGRSDSAVPLTRALRNSLPDGRRYEASNGVEKEVERFSRADRPSSRKRPVSAHRRDTLRPAGAETQAHDLNAARDLALCTLEQRRWQLTSLIPKSRHQRKKNSISPPTDFRHISHTPKHHVSRLNRVPAKSLDAEFWTLSTSHRAAFSTMTPPPKRQSGMSAAELRAMIHRELGIEKLPPPRLDTFAILSSSTQSPISPTSSIAAASRDPQPEKIPATYARVFDPRRGDKFTATALKTPPNTTTKQFSPSNGPPASRPASAPRHDAETSNSDKAVRNRVNRSQSAMEVPRQELSVPAGSTAVQTEKPLPPPPPSESALSSDYQTVGPKPSPAQRIATESTSASSPVPDKNVSRTSPQMHQLPCLPESRPFTYLDDSNWETDVEFCYEHSAEATCDFDWTAPLPPPAPTVKVNNAKSKPNHLVIEPLRPLVSQSSSVSMSSYGSISDSRPPSPLPEHRRGSSVGHRGFLAARKGTVPSMPNTPTTELMFSSFDRGLESPAEPKRPAPPPPMPQSAKRHPARVDSANVLYLGEANTFRVHNRSAASSTVSLKDIEENFSTLRASLESALHDDDVDVKEKTSPSNALPSPTSIMSRGRPAAAQRS